MPCSIWPEVVRRSGGGRCANCTGGDNIVPTDGPSNPLIVCIGEAPGANENDKGRPFIGDAGKDLNEHYLPLAGLDRDEVVLTNTCKCRPHGNRTPRYNEIKSCSNHFLRHELDLLQPEIVVLMGGTACKLTTDIDLEVHHGRPLRRILFGKEYWVFPTYHPALGIHDPSKIKDLIEDFTNLRGFHRGDWTGPQDAHPKPRYFLLGHPDYPGAQEALAQIKTDVRAGSLVATDTENLERRWSWWSWQLSSRAGMGVMGLITDREAMVEYQRILDEAAGVVMHHKRHDVGELRDGGVSVSWDKTIDTQPMAYRLSLSQSLKSLAYRLCGMSMRHYSEVVWGPWRKLVQDWIWDVTLSLPSVEEHYVTPKKQERKTRRVKNPLLTEFTDLRRYCNNNPDYDPRKRWAKLLDEPGDLKPWIQWVLDHVGPMPSKGLDKVPLSEAVWYGCRDSDGNIRVHDVLDYLERTYASTLNLRPEDCDELPEL